MILLRFRRAIMIVRSPRANDRKHWRWLTHLINFPYLLLRGKIDFSPEGYSLWGYMNPREARKLLIANADPNLHKIGVCSRTTSSIHSQSPSSVPSGACYDSGRKEWGKNPETSRIFINDVNDNYNGDVRTKHYVKKQVCLPFLEWCNRKVEPHISLQNQKLVKVIRFLGSCARQL